MVDQLLGGLFGAQDDDDEPTRRKRAGNFVDRYERGAYDQLGDDEVVQNYRATTSRLTPEEYQQVAADAFRKMSPEERRELKRSMRKQARAGMIDDDDDDSPEAMARAAQRVEQDNPDGGGLLGFLGLGGSGSGDDAPAGQQKEGGIDAMVSNPLVKVALAGVAAMAAKKLTQR